MLDMFQDRITLIGNVAPFTQSAIDFFLSADGLQGVKDDLLSRSASLEKRRYIYVQGFRDWISSLFLRNQL